MFDLRLKRPEKYVLGTGAQATPAQTDNGFRGLPFSTTHPGTLTLSDVCLDSGKQSALSGPAFKERNYFSKFARTKAAIFSAPTRFLFPPVMSNV